MSNDLSESSANLTLARQAANGDDDAFEQMFQSFRGHLKRFIELRLDDRIRARVDPSDVLQETQMEVHRRLKEYLQRDPMPLRVWLRRTAQEHMISMRDQHLRASKRSVAKEAIFSRQSSMLLAQRITSNDPSPSQQMSLGERQQLVTQAISRLGNDDREILLMRNMEDLNFDEIAATFEITAALARQRYGRAMIRLRKQLDAFGLGDNR